MRSALALSTVRDVARISIFRKNFAIDRKFALVIELSTLGVCGMARSDFRREPMDAARLPVTRNLHILVPVKGMGLHWFDARLLPS